MDFIIIRHGQSEADILDVHEGRADFPLTALGVRQAEAMAQWVVDQYKIDRIYASPLKRAAQTAHALSGASGVSIRFDEDLMEFNNGLIAGLSREEATRRYPEPSIKHPHTALYGMESMIAFRARLETAFSKIMTENKENATIAIVAHGGSIQMLFRSFLALPITTQVSISTGNTGIHHWRIQEGLRRVVYTNRLTHTEGL